mmetsp:Transcript_41823/g.105459  ORF Transcript_41823/g.105459 Transcript_41823/m.105459 type:complete len:239 (+) Transcript_41823:1166-1882(+)
MEVEALRQIKIQLNGSTLIGAAKGIFNVDVNLRPIESTITFVEFPLLSSAIQSVLKHCFSLVPDLDFAKEFLRTSGQLEGVEETKLGVDKVHEFQSTGNLAFHLIHSAEDVSVVLNKAAYASQTTQSTSQLVTMQHTPFGKTKRQIAMRASLGAKELTVTRTVHRLESMLGFLDLDLKNIFLIVRQVPRSLPQISMEYIWSDYFEETTLTLLATHCFKQSVVDSSAMGTKESTARGNG